MSKPKPRPYQREALDALDNHIRTKESNPCVVLPTGAGKSLVIAWTIQRWKKDHQDLRVCILAHRKELIEQNAEELAVAWPEADIGIFCAGLKQKDWDKDILYASIHSIYKHGGDFEAFDLIIVDEAHRIPPSGEGKYRSFIKLQEIQNKNIRVIGFTATPFRYHGALCHPDHILNEICYEADVSDLIAKGYLSRLCSRRNDIHPDLDEVRKNHGGDYIIKSLSKACTQDVVEAAIQDAIKVIFHENKKSVLFFCVDMDHVERVSKELKKYGVEAPYITANTSDHIRERQAKKFKNGNLRALCNINVYTEGFNARMIDCIVMLRPTLSKGLYYQMVGRGLRTYPDKDNCLVLDYANNIDEHGPIDCLRAEDVPVYTCKECENVFSRLAKTCPNCGWTIPKKTLEKIEDEERQKKLNQIKASNKDIVSGPAEWKNVDSVIVARHSKKDKPDSLRVEYRCGLKVYREWICLEHKGFAGRKAAAWWKKRFGEPTPTVDMALSWMTIADSINEVTNQILVKMKGKYPSIVGHRIEEST